MDIDYDSILETVARNFNENTNMKLIHSDGWVYGFVVAQDRNVSDFIHRLCQQLFKCSAHDVLLLRDAPQENTESKIFAVVPEYEGESFESYGNHMISRNKVLKECYNLMNEGGYVIWVDQVLPMYQ